MAKRDVFIIAYVIWDGEKVFYYKRIDGVPHFCFCKLSARRYLTHKGALHALVDLADSFGSNVSNFEIVNIRDLVDFYG